MSSLLIASHKYTNFVFCLKTFSADSQLHEEKKDETHKAYIKNSICLPLNSISLCELLQVMICMS